MAYVAPNSTIKLLSKVPLNNDYSDTMRYATRDAQIADFNQFVKYTLTEYSYQRHGRDYIRVTIPNITTSNPLPNNNVADDLFDVNYMMFQNTNFGNKWFYAFVTDVEYVNNSCAELKYEIDVMQTFMLDYSMPPVYVEREHTETDVAGDNVVEEGINVADLVPYKGQKYELTYDFSEITIFIMYIVNKSSLSLIDTDQSTFWSQNYPDDGGYIRNNIYSAVEFKSRTGSIRTQTDIDTLIAHVKYDIDIILGKNCTIIGMVELPTKMTGSLNFFQQAVDYITLNYSDLNAPINLVGYISRPTTFNYPKDPVGNYTPKNNKLFTFPYNQIKISNREGVYKTYKYEYFDGPSAPMFGLSYVAAPAFECSVFPRNYLYSRDGTAYIPELNPDLFVAGASLPLPTYTEDSYNLWNAQKSSSMTVDVLGNILKGAITALAAYYTGGTSAALMAGIGTAVVGSASTMISANISAKNAPDVFHGSQCSGELLTGMNIKGFDIEQLQIKPTLAKQIDSYFSLYGYACKSIKIPSALGAYHRPYWHYTKTLNCHAHPSSLTGASGIPTEYLNKINQVFDNGVRMWYTTLNLIDDYALNNAPT